MSEHIKNQLWHSDLVSDSTLHVVAVCSNPVRYHSRYRLFREFVARMRATKNVQLHLVELAYGDRHHEVTTAADLQLRTSAEIWHKENMINLGVRTLPRDWKYLAWIDGDVTFQNDNWALETIHALQHYPVVQPWSECIDLGPNGNALQMFRSFGSLVQKGVKHSFKDPNYPMGHSGYAWACTRTFWENTGGLIDDAILGAADHHMAWAMINRVDYSVNKAMSDSYKNKLRAWQFLANRETNAHIGAVPGLLHHAWHGSKTNRFYRERWQILVQHKFDPVKDLRKDAQGLYYLTGKPHLKEDIKQYFRSRNEDGIDE